MTHANTGTNSNAVNAPGSLMPSAIPENISHAMNHHQTHAPASASTIEMEQHRGAQHNNMMVNRNMNMPHQQFHQNVPMNNHMQMHHHHHHQQQQQQMQQANMQMHMQMNMMHQQMAMMQAAQQQHMEQQQQRQKHEQIQLHQLHQDASQIDNHIEDTKQAATVDHVQAEEEGVHVDEWHSDLEQEFQNYLNSYKNEIDVASTAGGELDIHDEIGYDEDGNAQGASIERLAAAWEEAERQFTQDDYANLAQGYDYYDERVGSDLELERQPQHQHYEFGQESKEYGRVQQGENNQDEYIDLMSEGMKHFKEGDTSEAILCFESELRNVDGNNADAWLMLGKCHAENDQDRQAITCLENAVERDPYSTEALLALGVSYVNELDHPRAFKYLHNWVTHNPNYAGLEMKTDAGHEGDEGALFQLKSLLNQAKQYDAMNGNVENSVDVLEALGVVCNVTREFDEAAECFRAATGLRPDDYQLFNKLGATLANSNRSEEAQDAYQAALAIKPKYARAWLNMAISHSNLQNHHEAARCYLQALSLNPSAAHVWSYLRIALTCDEKWDLLPLASSQDLNAFQEHFDFV